MGDVNSPVPAEAAPAVPAKASGAAIASLVLGILGFLTAFILVGFLLAIVGLILGIVALGKVSKGQAGGKGVAVAGTVISGIALLSGVFMVIMAVAMMPAITGARDRARTVKDMNNLRQLNIAATMYADDNGEYPEKLSDLYPDYAVDTMLFVDPWQSSPNIPEDSIDERSSYALVPGLSPDSPYDAVLMYNRAQMDKRESVNVALIGGNVNLMPVEELRRRLAAADDDL
ncbi:MAG: DUF4190 domain-containing protein [Planctomycetes bacterium]|nr:DUF4190 domain-containing protein [Planctomycetota bacterium]